MSASRSRVSALVLALSLALAARAPVRAQQPTVPAAPVPAAPVPDPALLARANRILAQVPVIDGHNDLPSELLDEFGGDPYAATLDKGQPKLQTDIPRLRAGHVGAQFWSAYVENDSIPTGGSLRVALRQVDMARRMIAAYPTAFEAALTSADITRIEKRGKIASLIGLEGGQGIDNTLAALRAMYQLGVRYMTLTHNTTLAWADAALGVQEHHGLTPFGVSIVGEMNRLGMFLDLAHVSAEVMRDALKATRAPVIFSHSSAFALVGHPRNVPDDVLAMMPANGGVVMVNFCPCFTAKGSAEWEAQSDSVIKAVRAQAGVDRQQGRTMVRAWMQAHPRPKATVSDIADHIDHLVKVAGIDHVGIGSDFDGIGGDAPLGLPDVSSYPALFAELARRGYSDADLKKVAGLNLLRAMKQMEDVAARLQKAERPSLADMVPRQPAR